MAAHARRSSRKFSVPRLVAVGLTATRLVLERIDRKIRLEPGVAFGTVQIGDGPKKKRALRIDLEAEDSFSDYLISAEKKIKVYGEERLADEKLNLSNESGVVALVDAVDGTDLLERGIGNWCTAAILFRPKARRGQRILAAFVGLPTGEIYFASNAKPGAFVEHEEEVAGAPAEERRKLVRRVYGASPRQTLRGASLYFYGQKAKNLFPSVSMLQNAAALSETEQKKRTAALAGLRLYNLAGTPMMVRMIDRRWPGVSGVDVVMDLVGQKPHDVVPGAFIALKAGASLVDEKGKKLEYTDLEDLLLTPASRKLKYVLAGTSALAHAVTTFLDLGGGRQSAPPPSRRGKR